METEIEVPALELEHDPTATAQPDDAAQAQPEQQDDEGAVSKRDAKKIKKLLGRTKEAEERAERLAAELEQERQRSRQATQVGVTYAEKSLDTQVQQARAAVRQAMQDGDGDALAEATEKLADIKAQQAQLRAGQHQQPERQQVQQRPQVSSKAQAWVADNPWFEEDKGKQRKALAIHAELVEDGYTPDSRAYYEKLTERTRDLAGEDDDEPAPRRQAAAGSGVTRTASPQQRPSTTKIRLSAEEVETAQSLNMTPAAYAAEKLRLQQAGAFDQKPRR